MEVAERVLCKVAIKELPRMRVATYRTISLKPEKDSSAYLKKIVELSGLNYDTLDKYGVDVPVPVKKLYRRLRGYESWVCIPDEIEEIEGAKVKTIPRNRYAVLRIKVSFKYPIESISDGWLELQDWVLKHGYRSSLHNPNKYMLEKHIEVKNDSFLELYFPLLNSIKL